MIGIKRGEFSVLSSEVLEDGQLAYSTDNHQFKIGDGSTAFAQLPRLTPDPDIYTSTWLYPPSSYNLGSSSAHINSSYIDDMYSDGIHGTTSSTDILVYNDVVPNSTTLALGSTSKYWYNLYTDRLHVQRIAPKGSSYNLTLDASGTNVRISNVATPTNNTDAANKSYVDGLINPNAGNLTNSVQTTSSKATYIWTYPDKSTSNSSADVGYFSIGTSNRAIHASSTIVSDTITIPSECLPTGTCVWMAFAYTGDSLGGPGVDVVKGVIPNFGYILSVGATDKEVEIELDISSMGSSIVGAKVGVLVMGTGSLGI